MTNLKLTALRNERGWPLHSTELKRLMGLPKKLPRESVPGRMIRGAFVWVEPAFAPIYVERWGKQVLQKSSKHRVMCNCPDCGDIVPAGRLAQHKCKIATLESGGEARALDEFDPIVDEYLRTGVLPG